MGTWSPVVVAIADELPLTDRTVWLACELAPGESYRLRALVDGGPDTPDLGAVVRLDASPRAGAPLTVRTGVGLHRTDRVFSVRGRVRRIGVSAVTDRGSMRIKTLVVERVPELDRPADVFLSFDVEAAPSRTRGEPIDQLVWGRLGGHEYGIPRICGVLEQHRLVGNFMVDFVTCAAKGDRFLQEIIEYLRGRGHEVHMHLHPEALDPSLGYRIGGHLVHLDRAPYDMSRSLLELALDGHTRHGGKAPYVFRSGGYRINDHLVRAAGELGITAMTNVKPHSMTDIAVGGDEVPHREPFAWDNGVLEIPVDASSPEVGEFKNYLLKYRDAISRKPTRPTFNVVMHSWSLTRRNDAGHHDAPAPEYEERLHQMCEHASAHGRVRGYAEYVESLPDRLPVRGIDQIRIAGRSHRSELCTICHAPVEVADGDCPSCGLGSRHRRLRFALNEYGDVLAGGAVDGVGLTSAERAAFLGHAAATAGASDGILWLAEPNRAEASAIMSSLRPGGVLVVPDRPTGDRALPRRFVSAVLPTIDPVTMRTGRVRFIYKVRAPAAWRAWVRGIGRRSASVAGVGGVARRLMRRARAVAGSTGRSPHRR